ncbi:MAG: PorT family protein [Treponema sp.]|jgi:hypothetical protein|nr:PorT family protein [Treponema sp.]
MNSKTELLQAGKLKTPARFAAGFVFLLALLVPPNLYAQTLREGYDGEGKAVVALLPLTGDEEAAAQFGEAVMRAVTALGRYNPRQVSRDTVEAAGLRIPTDMPPVRELTPGVRFALTGGVYPGNNDESQFYLQLWLWDMHSSAMIYTDDLVYEDTGSALESLPGLVEWLFSHIIERTEEAETEKEITWDHNRINAGVRSGVSQHWYTAPNESVPGAYSLTYEGGVFVAVRLTSLISLQAEFDLILDDLVYRMVVNTSKDITYNPVLANERRHSFSLLFPVLVKFTLRPGSFRLSPYVGLFAFTPLGKTRYSQYPGGKEGSFSWASDAPLGYSVGFEAARKLGPGILTADIRCLGDFSNITIRDNETNPGQTETVYKRSMLSFTIGYAFGFGSLKK